MSVLVDKFQERHYDQLVLGQRQCAVPGGQDCIED